ncbi:MAG: right-handed parallel beta-helix repeat-containing protein [Anaerolineaceae bacterium]|nr:MAG: right-handed parallel beta-helix repeat-containing protein [Anaerolineaceae bacterium]
MHLTTTIHKMGIAFFGGLLCNCATMRTVKLFLLIVLTLSLTNCSSADSTIPDPTATLAATPPPTDPAPTPAPIFEPTLTGPTGAFASAQIEFVANIETAGIYVSGEDLPENASILYRSSGDADWRSGHPMLQIDDGRLVGSLFGLKESTKYFVKVTSDSSEISGIVVTQPETLTIAPQNIIHVNASAPAGGDGSEAAPFQTIQEGVDRASAGTQVLVANGVYREEIAFPTSGAEEQWIQVKAAGTGALIDGSEILVGEWNVVPKATQVWSFRLKGAVGYLARDGKHFHQYADMKALLRSRGAAQTTVTEGWFHDTKSGWLYVRSADDPSSHTWRAAVLDEAFNINGRDWIWIEGFDIGYYGRNSGGCGICALNASHLVIRNNRIHNLQKGVYVHWESGNPEQGNDMRIEFNEIFDPGVDEIEWNAAKGTYAEGTGIILRGHVGAIVRGNRIHNFFNGIYTGTTAGIDNPEIARDADIYDNMLDHISDDGLEPEGACVNHRFRHNRVDTMLVGFSNAPVTQGPTWVIRNLFTNFTSTSIKWARNPDGAVYFYHNTFYTNAPDLNAMSMITIGHNAVMRNNIFQGNGFAFEESHYNSSGMDWDYDNWHTTRDASLPHFRWETIDYLSIALLCASTGLECHGHESPPGFANPLGGDFSLLSTSPNIDRGVVIPGINDSFVGNGPDIGVFEYVSP